LDKKRIVIPIHSGKDIKRKTLSGIIKDMGIKVEEFEAKWWRKIEDRYN